MREASAVYDVPQGTAYFTAQQIIVYATSLLYYILLFRILNLTDIGQISLLTATTAIFTTLTQLALPVTATRFISRSLGSRDPHGAAAVAKT